MFKILSTYICWKRNIENATSEGSGTPVLYIGRTVLKGLKYSVLIFVEKNI